MAMQRALSKNKSILVASLGLVIGLILLASLTRARTPVNVNTTSVSNGILLYASFTRPDSSQNIQSLALSTSAPALVADFGNNSYANYHKELYLSPDGNFIAVTLNPVRGDAFPQTYISTVGGETVAVAHLGRFVSWSPDSGRALLYVSPIEAPWSRKIYALDTRGQYYDMGLPDGTITAAVSPIDGSILYSLTTGGTDDSSILVRDPQGNDTVLVKGGGNNILTWTRWSSKGDKIVLLKSDLYLSPGKQEVLVMSSDGTREEVISTVDWGYPPVWSPDGTKVTFSDQGNIWEYDTAGKSLRNVSGYSHGTARHPSYSADGSAIVFSSDVSGETQIWSEKNGVVAQLTNGIEPKDYPILP